MAIELTPEQRKTGDDNYVRAAKGLTRRGFLKSMAVAGAAVVPVSAAVYFGYEACTAGRSRPPSSAAATRAASSSANTTPSTSSSSPSATSGRRT